MSSHAVDKQTGVQCDETIRLVWFYSSRGDPSDLRWIRYRDPQTGKRLVFLTNNFSQPASVITELHRCRWQVELFFKWIKQHLHIKAFYGTSENAVKTQVWTAVCSYLLAAIARQRLSPDLKIAEVVSHNQLGLLDF